MTYHERTSRNIEFAYKNGNDYSIQLARWFLIPIGAWPLTNVSMIERISLQMQILIGFLMLGTVVIPCSLYVLLEAEDTQIKISTVGPLSHWFLGVINYWLLLMRTDDIRKCVLHMETDWQLVRKIDEQDTMLRYAKIGRFVSVFCALFLQSGALLFIVAKAMGNTTVTIGNDTVSIYALGCPIYCEFVDTRFSPANEIMLVIEFITCFMVNSVTVGTCSLATIFAMHACGQLSILFSWLNELVTDDDKENQYAEQRLTVIIEQHLRVLSFISRMENVIQQICLVELLECTMNMCLLAYYSIMNWSEFDTPKITSYVIVYISMAMNIFIFCYIGEILTEQCKNVGEKIYMTNWYDLPHKTALGLILVIARSNNVINITAGKVFQLSLATFGSVIKTSFMYLNILRTMT